MNYKANFLEIFTRKGKGWCFIFPSPRQPLASFPHIKTSPTELIAPEKKKLEDMLITTTSGLNLFNPNSGGGIKVGDLTRLLDGPKPKHFPCPQTYIIPDSKFYFLNITLDTIFIWVDLEKRKTYH